MSRQLILLSALAVAAGGYLYVQWQEESAHADMLAKKAAAAKEREQALRESEELVSQARELLDAYRGQRELLNKASGNLERVLRVNPLNVEARIERARFHIIAGHIYSRKFQPGTLDRAEKDLQYALLVDSNSADAYVLMAHVFYLRSRLKEALLQLEKAESIGTDNPWLHMNWADALMDLNRWGEAEARLRKTLARYGTIAAPPRRIVRSMHEKLGDLYTRQRKVDDADREYKAALAVDPTYAWGRGNYADFLLFTRGMPDAAIAEAEKTIEIMDYGMVRLTLSAARYAKWAEVKRRSPEQAAQYLAAAKAGASDFSWIMPQAAKSVSAGPAIHNMVKELVALGVPLDTRDEDGDTGLTLAARLGDVESVAILIKLGANINAADKSGQTALATAANQGYIELAKALGARGANVNSSDEKERTPLSMAVANGDRAMAQALIGLKADLNLATAMGYTPLMSAAFRGDEEMVRLLLQAGADPTRELQDKKQTAADLAALRGHQELAAKIRTAAEKRGAPRR